MTDNYLRTAKHILQTRARPMTAQEILEDARSHGLLPEHLTGQTMQKTLQARIAEDIFDRRQGSAFYRTNVGTYYLRALARDSTLPSRKLREFEPTTRSVRVPPFRILYARLPTAPRAGAMLPYRYPLSADETVYRYIWESEDDAFTVTTMTIVLWRSKILVHRVGRYSYFYRGDDTLTAGFHRYIDEYDIDLFVDDPVGTDMSAQREYARIVGGQIASSTIEPTLIATHMDPNNRRITFGIAVQIGDNSPYSGQLLRRLDVRDLRWTELDVARNFDLDPLSREFLFLVSGQ